MPRAGQGALLALFRQPEEVIAALEDLRAAGFAGSDLKVLSGTPYPAGTFGEEEQPHHLFVFAFAGAAAGFIVGLLVTIGTQISYPMVTGGKPILGIPPMINVLYEATLLGAIIFTVLGTLFESRLPNLSERPYDPRITQGYLGVMVRCRDREAPARVERIFRSAGAVDLIPPADAA
jgi:hypothetical protein